MTVLETPRLRLRRVGLADAAFLLQLVNEPSWLEQIGDRGVRTLAEAAAYVDRAFLRMYEQYGHGLYLVELRNDAQPIGLCGLLRRDGLADVDLGFAMLPAYWGQGYAHESAAAVMTYGKSHLGLKRLVAITALENARSTRLLEKLGFRHEKTIQLPGQARESKWFVHDLASVRDRGATSPA